MKRRSFLLGLLLAPFSRAAAIAKVSPALSGAGECYQRAVNAGMEAQTAAMNTNTATTIERLVAWTHREPVSINTINAIAALERLYKGDYDGAQGLKARPAKAD